MYEFNFNFEILVFFGQIKYRKYLDFAKSIIATLPPGVVPEVNILCDHHNVIIFSTVDFYTLLGRMIH